MLGGNSGFRGSFFGSGCYNCPDPCFNCTIVQFDAKEKYDIPEYLKCQDCG